MSCGVKIKAEPRLCLEGRWHYAYRKVLGIMIPSVGLGQTFIWPVQWYSACGLVSLGTVIWWPFTWTWQGVRLSRYRRCTYTVKFCLFADYTDRSYILLWSNWKVNFKLKLPGIFETDYNHTIQLTSDHLIWSDIRVFICGSKVSKKIVLKHKLDGSVPSSSRCVSNYINYM